ncbi:MAG TPA: alpha/beta fold hydrolase [Acidimicrobiales bacterium]
MTDVVMPGGEPYFSPGGPFGVLLLHGFTSTTSTMMDLARSCVCAGYSAAVPRLPGHGTSVDDLMTTGWDDWADAALAAYDDLAATCTRVAIVGLSMGGTLAVHVAAQRPDVAAFVFINPYVKHQGLEWDDLARTMLESGATTYDSIGSDIKKEGVKETSYDQTPIASALTLLEAVKVVNDNLGRITAPSLLLSSTEDHVVELDNGDELVKKSNGTVERIWLENSYHVATLDNDAPLIESAMLAFLAGHLDR